MRPEAVDRYDAEALRLSRLLALAVKQKEVSVRSLEKKMRVGDSVFSKVLKGRVGLQVRHVLMIADAIGLDWKEFFAVAYGLAVQGVSAAAKPWPTGSRSLPRGRRRRRRPARRTSSPRR